MAAAWATPAWEPLPPASGSDAAETSRASISPGAGPLAAPPRARSPSTHAHVDPIDRLRQLLDGFEPDPSSGLMMGAQGHAARDLYISELEEHPAEFTHAFRKLLAREMETELSELRPAGLRGFFERRVAFGQHRLLQHLGSLLARFWELA